MTDLLKDVAWADLDIDYLITQSYKDFHAKGLDYVCLHRTPELTLKAYFFAEGMESQKVGEVINPHNHRYDFDTQCMSGIICNKTYRNFVGNERVWQGSQLYNEFNYLTPLNGGDGFEYKRQMFLSDPDAKTYYPGQQYFMSSGQFHTIQVRELETCIVLAQHADRVPVGVPTTTFVQYGGVPSLKGLYSEFSADELVSRIALLRELQAAL